MNKKSQLGPFLTEMVALLLIFFIIVIFLLVASALSANKKLSDFFSFSKDYTQSNEFKSSRLALQRGEITLHYAPADYREKVKDAVSKS